MSTKDITISYERPHDVNGVLSLLSVTFLRCYCHSFCQRDSIDFKHKAPSSRPYATQDSVISCCAAENCTLSDYRITTCRNKKEYETLRCASLLREQDNDHCSLGIEIPNDTEVSVLERHIFVSKALNQWLPTSKHCASC